MERPRPLAHPAGALGQEHPLVAAEGPRESDDRAARHAARGQPSQSAPLPRLPAPRRASAALSPAQLRARTGAPRCLAELGGAVKAQAVPEPVKSNETAGVGI